MNGKVLLVPELWLVIFEYLVEERAKDYYSTRPNDFLQIILVCKQWKTLAQPLLYRCLRFGNREALDRFLLLFQTDSARCLQIEQSIRSLTVRHTVARSRQLSQLLGHCSNLREYKADLVGAADLSAIEQADSSKRCLERLDIGLDLRGWDLAPLALIGSLTGLQHLDLEIICDRGGPLATNLNSADPWNLLHLRYLGVTELYSDANVTPFETFLARSRFPNLEKLKIIYPQTSFSPAIQDFLQTHPHIEDLELYSASDIAAVRCVLPSLQTLVLQTDSGLDAALIENFPSSLRHIRLMFSSEQNLGHGIELFAALGSGSCPFHLDRLHMGGEWTWRGAFELRSKRAKWLSRAEDLRNRGIAMLDKNGDDAFTVKEIMDSEALVQTPKTQAIVPVDQMFLCY
ncbi:hypothetical protein DACRYDRAFT_117774 [Dacryopinax primogenitus]|uniref:Uncharacterized protein n=1 Tax=Dacryopinax primogenitus (strain DJM 731) TaxID=1858805 RepID=M5FVA7_DACPD|nr:uncharacterized protein DACRYDRAFT_117774 [Dacryopinax primogenitus]EJT99549.1 hypothetical protein DACRYDRAFT_117774 [Dacryopinax primogenitus]